MQALKRKPDLFLCSNLDVKAVFQCGEYRGQGHAGRDLLPALCGEPGLLLQLWEQSSQGMVLLLVWDGA